MMLARDCDMALCRPYRPGLIGWGHYTQASSLGYNIAGLQPEKCEFRSQMVVAKRMSIGPAGFGLEHGIQFPGL